MRRRFTETAEEDRREPPETQRLPVELERRIEALEGDAAAQRDFDPRSWLWLILLGVVLPVVVLILGWSL
jgi:hypothetical protein